MNNSIISVAERVGELSHEDRAVLDGYYHEEETTEFNRTNETPQKLYAPSDELTATVVEQNNHDTFNRSWGEFDDPLDLLVQDIKQKHIEAILTPMAISTNPEVKEDFYKLLLSTHKTQYEDLKDRFTRGDDDYMYPDYDPEDYMSNTHEFTTGNLDGSTEYGVNALKRNIAFRITSQTDYTQAADPKAYQKQLDAIQKTYQEPKWITEARESGTYKDITPDDLKAILEPKDEDDNRAFQFKKDITPLADVSKFDSDILKSVYQTTDQTQFLAAIEMDPEIQNTNFDLKTVIGDKVDTQIRNVIKAMDYDNRENVKFFLNTSTDEKLVQKLHYGQPNNLLFKKDNEYSIDNLAGNLERIRPNLNMNDLYNELYNVKPTLDMSDLDEDDLQQ